MAERGAGAISALRESKVTVGTGRDAVRWPHMRSPDQMLSEALAAERLAAVVSYGPDKARLLAQADRLKAEARAAESRSFAPRDVRSRR
jgi:hypothetical protein